MAYYQLEVHDVEARDIFDNILEAMDHMELLGPVFSNSMYTGDLNAGILQAENEVVWVSADVDMKDLSLKFPDETFRLCVADGDNNYHDYYKAGQAEHCPIEVRYTAPVTIAWEEK